MRVLVTRPQDDAEETAAELVARGHKAIVAPLLEVKFREGGEVALDGVQAILITSANGIRALAARTKRRDVKVLAVGAQSAAATRAMGFRDVSHADGDATALADLTRTTLAWKDGVLLHATGAETRGNLAERLSALGFTVKRAVLYEAVAAKALPDAARAALVQRSIDAALFYSPRTAHIFAGLVAQAGLGPACQAIRACCISQATADALAAISFQTVLTAPHPDQKSLLSLLDA